MFLYNLSENLLTALRFEPMTGGSSPCFRSIRFNFKEEAEVEGVSAYKYHLDETLVANATHNPDNWCFNYMQDVEQVVPNGVMNVSACKFNAPAFVSFPHFYKADPFYLNQFEPGSLNPQEELHESHLSLEPISGVPLDVKVRMQINALMRPLNRWQTSEDGSTNYTLSVRYLDHWLSFLTFCRSYCSTGNKGHWKAAEYICLVLENSIKIFSLE